MWMMLQQPKPGDFVIATGETHSVGEFLSEAFGLLGLDWKKFVSRDEKQLRPAEVGLLLGDASRAEKALGWKPKVTFKALVKMMIDADMSLAESER